MLCINHRLLFEHWIPDVCRHEAVSGELGAGGLGGSGGREQQPAERSGQRGRREETQSQRAQEGVPLLPLQQGLPEQQQPQPAHPLTRCVEVREAVLCSSSLSKTSCNSNAVKPGVYI